MSRRIAALATSGLVALVLTAFVLGAASVFPPAGPLTTATGERTPESTVSPLPEFTREAIIPVEFSANGTAGESGVFWMLLYYRIAGASEWIPYRPPWNPEGRFFGALGFEAGLMEGTIPFDTYYAGGEATYEFSTVAVDRGYKVESGPEKAKAKTTLDTRPPRLFIESPTPGSWTREKVVRWNASDEVSGVAAVEVALSGQDPVSFPDARGSAELDLADEGNPTVRVTARDRAENAADVWVPFHFDPNSPVLTITSPAPGSYSRSTSVEVAWEAGDTGSGLASLRLSVDAAPAVDLDPAATAHALEDLAERAHSVTLLATDLAGNVASQTVTFGVDATAPALELLAPSDSGFTNVRDLLVLWLGHDTMSGVDRYELTLDGGGLVTLGPAAGYTFPNVAEGARVVRVAAYDRAGNSAAVSARVTVDVTKPVVSLTKPAGSDPVSGDLEIGWTATDAGSGIARVEILYDGTPIVATGASTHRIESPTSGAHYVVVRAVDRAGNVAEVGRAFTYVVGAPPAPGPFGIPALEFWLLMLLVGVLSVGLAFYAVRRRKRSET